MTATPPPPTTPPSPPRMAAPPTTSPSATTSAPTGPRKRKRRLLLGLVGVALVLGGGAGTWWFVFRDEAPAAEDVSGMVFGSVEDAQHAAAGGVDVVVTPAGGDQELARAVTDELGLFEVALGDHEGPVVVRASRPGGQAATVVAVNPDGVTTGLRLVIGEPGTGAVEGQVVAPEGAALDEAGTVEARFVETGRTDVIALGPDARFRFDALPLDGDLILVATTASGSLQGLTATVVSESLASNTADITLRSPADPAAAHQVDDPDIVTDDLDDWVLDGPVTVVPVDELGG
jgi:hypothetical protein